MTSRRRFSSDVWLALAIAVASLFFVAYQLLNPAGTALFGVSPSTFPLAMSGLILLLSLVMLAQAFAAAPRSGSAGGDQRSWRVPALVALSVLFVAALPWLGYLVASALFVGATAWLFGAKRPLVVMALMVLTPLLISVFFERAMVIFLPGGRLLQ